jgi:hypothetical protein
MGLATMDNYQTTIGQFTERSVGKSMSTHPTQTLSLAGIQSGISSLNNFPTNSGHWMDFVMLES